MAILKDVRNPFAVEAGEKPKAYSRDRFPDDELFSIEGLARLRRWAEAVARGEICPNEVSERIMLITRRLPDYIHDIKLASVSGAEWITVKDAADLGNLSQFCVYDRIRTGEIPPEIVIKTGARRGYRLNRAGFVAWLERIAAESDD